MIFDPNKELNLEQHKLQEIILNDNYIVLLKDWVNNKSKAGLSKKQIYDILLLCHVDIQKRPDPNEIYYDRLTDFLDLFTSWAKEDRILPEEPDI